MQAARSDSWKIQAGLSAPLFLCLFAVYLKTLCGSVYLDDSGETATIAVLLGLGHPPGYPFHTLLARLATLVLPGSPAFAVNLLAALLAALAAVAAFALNLRLAALALPDLGANTRRAAALAGALLLGLGPVWWHQALVAKGSVYQLNNLLTMGLFLCLVPLEPGRAPSLRALRLFWLLLGVALAHHYMSQAVLVPAYAALMWLSLRPPRGRHAAWRLLKDAWLALPGVSLYLYLVLRAAHDPAVNWSAIRSFDDFLFHFLRRQYSSSEVAGAVGVVGGQSLEIAHVLLREGCWIVTPLALAALVWLFRRRSALALPLALALAGPVLGAALYFNLGPDRYYIMKPHLFPAYMAQGIAGGLGLALALGRAGGHAKAAAVGLLIAVAAVPPLAQWRTLSLAQWHFALDGSRDFLLSAPRNSLVLVAGDSLVFPLWYLQHYERRRPDVAVAGVPVLPMDWVRHDLARRFPDLLLPQVNGPVGAESVPALTQGLIRLNWGRRPIYAGFNKKDENIAGYSLMPCGVLYQLYPDGLDRKAVTPWAAPAAGLWKAYNSRGLEAGSRDPDTRRLFLMDAAVHRNSWGTWREELGDYAGARACYLEALRLQPQDEEFAFNVGNASYQMGNAPEAERWYRHAISLNPRYTNAHYNLAVALSAMGRAAESRAELEKVLELDPTRQEVRGYLGGN